jgi:hypothetical protein
MKMIENNKNKITLNEDMKVRLSTLWIFATLNYVYADVIILFDKSVVFNLTQGALFGASLLVETAILMVLLSRILPYRANRWANIVVGVLNTMAVLLSLTFSGKIPALYYMFFAVIEIVTTSLIVWYAWKWPNTKEIPNKI